MSLMFGMICVGVGTLPLFDNVADAEVDNTPANDVPFHEQRYSKKVAVVELYLNSDRFHCWLQCMNGAANVHQKSIEWNESCDCRWHLLELGKKSLDVFLGDRSCCGSAVL